MILSAVIVDDSKIDPSRLGQLLARFENVRPLCFSASEEALAWCGANPADLVIVDCVMPAPDGVEFIRRFRRLPGCADLPVVMVTADGLKEARHEALQAGATDFLTTPVDQSEFLARLRNMIELRRGQKLLADRAALLAQEVAAATATIAQRERETIIRLSKAAEYRDPETGAHILRMAHCSRLIAAGMGLPAERQQLIFEAAPMHDIGKVGTPDYILLKPGRLTDAEFAVMKRHAVIGHEILAGSNSPILQEAAVIALSHHEKLDGSGYPQGLSGEAIPLAGRIVALADVFDALTSDRPYKKAWDDARAVDFIRAQAGSHFDPAIVAVFLDRLEEILAVRRRFGHEEMAD